MKKMKNVHNKKISGLSLLEALISTAIVGIGFIAILQMTNYSVQSIYTSGERTKANYLTNMIAEDVIGHRKIVTGGATNFSDWLSESDNQFDSEYCLNAAEGQASANTGNIYGDDEVDGPLMKRRKWMAILSNRSYLNCRGTQERRNFRIFKIGSRWSPPELNTLINNNRTTINIGPDQREVNLPIVTEDVIYIGRIQMNLNDGKKRKFLYFQSDYILKP
tara:strand:+ start:589 stop:1248 length:660 start_codon:yes stop_codon:yes gene_type:complete